MPTLFGIGLVALEIVDGRADLVALFFTRRHRVNDTSDDSERLERDHQLVVLHVIASENQDLLRHGGAPS
ncbi:hypothetical protein B0G57_11013 [Trinickia symbiotica]|nr:hypothetical protein B0G57_11013 [Trinickia symbiotica]